jgi:hypothetical protein
VCWKFKKNLPVIGLNRKSVAKIFLFEIKKLTLLPGIGLNRTSLAKEIFLFV